MAPICASRTRPPWRACNGSSDWRARGPCPATAPSTPSGSVPASGLLYHRLFSSTAADFISESEERRAAIGAVSAALAPLAADVTWILDSGFDDVAMWSAIWAQEASLVCRLQHDDRWVETRHGTPCHLA